MVPLGAPYFLFGQMNTVACVPADSTEEDVSKYPTIEAPKWYSITRDLTLSYDRLNLVDLTHDEIDAALAAKGIKKDPKLVKALEDEIKKQKAEMEKEKK